MFYVTCLHESEDEDCLSVVYGERGVFVKDYWFNRNLVLSEYLLIDITVMDQVKIVLTLLLTSKIKTEQLCSPK